MYPRSQAVKRPRQVPSHSVSTFHHTSSTQPAVPGQTSSTRPRGHTNPHINPAVFKPRDMSRLDQERRETKYGDSLCEMCTGEGSKYVQHTHFSTANLRTFALCYTEKDTFMCPICKVLEPVIPDKNTSRRIILTSSTLYGVWEQPCLPPNTEHFELEAIVGGRVRDLTVALKAGYLYLPHRLEIIVVAGINNIGEGQHPDKIVGEMKELKEMVRLHSEENQHSKPSYVSFCTIILPPKFCSLHIPENAPHLAEWVPGPNFKNRYKDIEAVNKKVKEMNLEDNLRYVNLHEQGVKFFKSGTIQHKFDSLPGRAKIWRENEVRRKLHFTMENKLKVVSCLNNCFKANSNR